MMDVRRIARRRRHSERNDMTPEREAEIRKLAKTAKFSTKASRQMLADCLSEIDRLRARVAELEATSSNVTTNPASGNRLKGGARG